MKRPSFLRYFICLFDFELVLLPRFFLPAELVFFERFLRDFFFQKRSPRRGGLFGRHFLLLVMTELFRYKSVAPALHLLLRQRVSITKNVLFLKWSRQIRVGCPSGFTGFYWVLLGFTGFYWVLPGLTVFYWVLLGFTGFYWVLQGFTEFYWVVLGCHGFYWVLLGFNRVPRGTNSAFVLVAMSQGSLITRIAI